MKTKLKNSGVEGENDGNPFLVNDPETVWSQWKKTGKSITKEELAKRIRDAASEQKKK